MNQLAPITASYAPPLSPRPAPVLPYRFLEFFTANICDSLSHSRCDGKFPEKSNRTPWGKAWLFPTARRHCHCPQRSSSRAAFKLRCGRDSTRLATASISRTT